MKDPNGPWILKCPECIAAGERSTVRSASTVRHHAGTVEVYWDEEGRKHVHDPNETTVRFRCSKGHEFDQTHKQPCPGCRR